MNVVFFTRLFYPHIGGVETHVRELSRLLAKEHTVHVVTEQYSPELSLKEQLDGVTIWRIPMPQSISESQKKWQVWKWLQNHQALLDSADILHAHDVHFWLWPYKLTHPTKKTFITFHGWEGIYPIPIKNKVVRAISEKIANGTICVGDYITKWYGTHPNKTIYGAVSVSKNPGAPHDKLLFWGRLDKDTGFTDFLELVKLLGLNSSQVVIAGDGPLRHLVPPGHNFQGFSTNVDQLIGQSKYVFCTGYLGMLDAFARKRLVLSTYHNPVKQDYLCMHPMSHNFIISDTASGVLGQLSRLSPADLTQKVANAYNWSKLQTWGSLVQDYKTLWKL